MDLKEITRLHKCFPGSFINSLGEFIAVPKSNAYFNIESCETSDDIKCKVIEYVSRSACKSTPYWRDCLNEQLHNNTLKAMNEYLGTSFTKEDMSDIYAVLGNGIRHDLTKEFIKNYDLNIIYGVQKGEQR